MHLCVPDNAASWDARPSASPSLSEVAPPIDSLSMTSPSSHLVPVPEPPHLLPLDILRDSVMVRDSRTERSKSPQKAELLNPDLGRRAAATSGGSRVRKEGGRSTHKGHRVQPASEGGGDKDRETGESKPFRSTRGRSKERHFGDNRELTHSPSCSKLPHTNGNSREDVSVTAADDSRTWSPSRARLGAWIWSVDMERTGPASLTRAPPPTPTPTPPPAAAAAASQGGRSRSLLDPGKSLDLTNCPAHCAQARPRPR